MEKIDLFRQFSAEYKAKPLPALVETAPAQYMAIDGKGQPGGPEFEDRIGALYSMAYTVKMTRKSEGLQDYTIGKLEALWHTAGDPDQKTWRWTLMIRTPECVTDKDTTKAIDALMKKGKCQNVRDVKLRILSEGQCVQMLHVGPYENVGQAIEQMQAFAAAQNLSFAGSHHEIYLSDPRRVAPDRIKTIVRHPVK